MVSLGISEPSVVVTSGHSIHMYLNGGFKNRLKKNKSILLRYVYLYVRVRVSVRPSHVVSPSCRYTTAPFPFPRTVRRAGVASLG